MWYTESRIRKGANEIGVTLKVIVANRVDEIPNPKF
jgi:hypothetical protein